MVKGKDTVMDAVPWKEGKSQDGGRDSLSSEEQLSPRK